jgi:hypothetical protein
MHNVASLGSLATNESDDFSIYLISLSGFQSSSKFIISLTRHKLAFVPFTTKVFARYGGLRPANSTPPGHSADFAAAYHVLILRCKCAIGPHARKFPGGVIRVLPDMQESILNRSETRNDQISDWGINLAALVES